MENWTCKIALLFLCGQFVLTKGSDELSENNSTITRDKYARLLNKLFSDRSSMMPPNAGDPRYPVNVSIEMNVQTISGLDMVQQKLTTLNWFKVRWTDRFLSWDSETYPGQKIDVDVNVIWRPDLVVFNSLTPKDSYLDQKMKVQVQSDGSVYWSPGDVLTSLCRVDIRKFPFDTQTCPFSIGFWSQSETNINITHARLVVSVKDNPEWTVSDPTARRSRFVTKRAVFLTYVLSMTLHRRSLFYALNVLLPVLLVSALNSVVFALPVECGEKMSVSLTTFLTLAVFTTLIQDSLPSNSDTVCYLALYLAFQLFLAVLAVVLTTFVVACHSRGSAVDDNASYSDDQSTKSGEQQNGRVNWHRVGLLTDKICFPVFIVLDVLSFAVYCLFIVAK